MHFPVYRRRLRRVAIKVFLVSLFFSLPTAYGTTYVFDLKKFLKQKKLNAIQASIAQSMDAVSKLDKARKDVQKAIGDQLGAVTKITLAPLAATTSALSLKDYASVRDVASSVKPLDPILAAYQKWDEKRRVSEAVMDEQLSAILKSNNGSELDWTGHSKLASTTQALTNDRIASSIANATVFSERQIKEKKDIAKLMRLELEAAQRKAAEDRLDGF